MKGVSCQCVPVEPKPPPPRPVSEASAASAMATCTTGAMIKLGDAHAARYRERLVAVIDQQHVHLAAIVGVDRAGRVEAGDAVPERQAGARPHLAFEGRTGFRTRNRSAQARGRPARLSVARRRARRLAGRDRRHRRTGRREAAARRHAEGARASFLGHSWRLSAAQSPGKQAGIPGFPRQGRKKPRGCGLMTTPSRSRHGSCACRRMA